MFSTNSESLRPCWRVNRKVFNFTIERLSLFVKWVKLYAFKRARGIGLDDRIDRFRVTANRRSGRSNLCAGNGNILQGIGRRVFDRKICQDHLTIPKGRFGRELEASGNLVNQL